MDGNQGTLYIALLDGLQTHAISRNEELRDKVKILRSWASDYDAYAVDLSTGETAIIGFVSRSVQLERSEESVEILMEEVVYTAKKRGITCLNIASFAPNKLKNQTIKKLEKWISIKFESTYTTRLP